jgi:hypothetical protein
MKTTLLLLDSRELMLHLGGLHGRSSIRTPRKAIQGRKRKGKKALPDKEGNERISGSHIEWRG